MANEIYVSFGGFELSDTNKISISKIEPQEKKDINTTKIPQSDFSVAEEARRELILINMEGAIIGTDYDNLRSNIDAFKAALQGKQKLTYDNDRFIMAQIQSFNCPFANMRTIARWTASFLINNPFWLSETLHTDERVPTSGVGYTINNAGNASARIKIEITAPAGGISDNIKIENTINSKSFQYRGTVAAGNILEVDNRVDTDDLEVLNNNADAMVDFEGDFITLQPGDNTIIFTGTQGAIVKISHRDIWY